MNFLSGVMLNNDLLQQIKGNFPYEPTEEQEITIKFFVDFLFSPKSEFVLLLKGYAGTGKTTLISALVKTIRHIRSKCVLLAPTGRAARFLLRMLLIRLIRFTRKSIVKKLSRMKWIISSLRLICIGIPYL